MFQGDLKNNAVLKDNQQIYIEIDKIDEFSTGRLYKWNTASIYIINSKIKNILFGNGPEFDRKIEVARGRGDVANGILYAFLCGGLLGLFSFFILIKKFLKIILYTIYNKKKLNTDVYFCFSVCCIISLTLRTLVENGFLVYGVDFLLVTSSVFYLIKKLKLI
jgi:O-antigen ligase